MSEQRLRHGRSTRKKNRIGLSRQKKRRHSRRRRRVLRSAHRDVFSNDTLQLFARNVGEFLAEVLEPGGCCLAFPILFLGGIGTLSGWLIWHSVLLGMLKGGTALVTLIAFVVLAFFSRKEREAQGSQANASVCNSAGST